MASSSVSSEQTFIGPGLSPFKRIVTIVGIIILVGLVLWIAVYQNSTRNDATVIGSSIAAILFIAGFVYYLGLVAPIPFTITINEEGITKRNRKGESIALTWDQITRVKEEFFPNGKRISVAVHRKVTSAGQKSRAWVVYRDDIDDIDRLAETLKNTIPATCKWDSETVHE